jgi:hypothetical protein
MLRVYLLQRLESTFCELIDLPFAGVSVDRLLHPALQILDEPRADG